MVDRLHVLIQGRVQGVGFRYSTVHKAQELGLAGWVANAHEYNRVEAVFEGEKSRLEEMLVWCHSGPPLARVDNVDATFDTTATPLKGFRVRY